MRNQPQTRQVCPGSSARILECTIDEHRWPNCDAADLASVPLSLMDDELLRSQKAGTFVPLVRHALEVMLAPLTPRRHREVRRFREGRG